MSGVDLHWKEQTLIQVRYGGELSALVEDDL